MAIYYVDQTGGDDSWTGLAGAFTSGTTGPWKTVAKVNGSTFSGDDQILFKRGETWREQLTVPSSGTSGHQIVFGAYGSGALPIINGADLFSSGWSVYGSGGWTTTWSATLGLNDWRSGDRNARSVITGTASGTKVRVTIKAHPSFTAVLDGCSIGERSGSTDDYSSAPTRITFGGGNNTATLTQGQDIVSDEITYTFTHTNPHLLHVYLGNHSGAGWSYTTSGANGKYWANDAGDISQNQTVSMSSLASGEADMVSKVEVYADGQTNVWQRTVATEPKIVLFNNTLGTKVASIAAVTSANKWFWASGVLYVYSTSDPATAFTSPGIEAGQRDYVAVVKKGYITLQDLRITRSNNKGINFSNVWSDSTVIATPRAIRVQADYNFGVGIEYTALGTDLTDLLCQDCTINSNGDAGIFVGNWDKYVTGGAIQRNSLTGNNWAATGPLNPTHAGISVTSTGEGAGQAHEYGLTNVLVAGNIVTGGAQEPGIWIDTVGSGVVVRYNKCYGNYDGIMVEDSSGVQVYYNLAYINTRNGIQVTRLVHNNLIYNNVAYGNANGIAVGFTDPSAGGVTGNIFKNNISVGNSTIQLTAQNGGENDGTNGSGNVYLNNCLGVPSASHFIQWGASYKDSVAVFDTAYGSATATLGSDPLLVNPSTDFHLQGASPCINAGVGVGLTADFDGVTVPDGPVPDIGAYEHIVQPFIPVRFRQRKFWYPN